MSPHRKLSVSSNRNPTVIQDIFLGLSMQLAPQPELKDGQDPGRELEYTAVLHDGTGVVESETFHFNYKCHGKDEDALASEAKKFSTEVLALMRSIQTDKHMKVSKDR